MNEEDVWCWKWPAWIQALRYMNLSLFLLSDKSNRRALTPSQSARECREILDIPYYKVQYDCWCTVIKVSINGAMAPSHIWCIRWGWGFVWRWKLQHYQANNLKSLIPSINTTEIKTIHVTETKRKKKKGGYNIWPLWKPTRKLSRNHRAKCEVDTVLVNNLHLGRQLLY